MGSHVGTLSEVDLLPPPPTVVGANVGLGVAAKESRPSNCNELGSTVAEASEGTPSALAFDAKVVEKVPLCIAVESKVPIALYREVAADASPDSIKSTWQAKTTPPVSSRIVWSNRRLEDTSTVTSVEETPTVDATASATACCPVVPTPSAVTPLAEKEYEPMLTRTAVGDGVGFAVGGMGTEVGASDGALDGPALGSSVGLVEGGGDGRSVSVLGIAVGLFDGIGDGSLVGNFDGEVDGAADGPVDGSADGTRDGPAEGMVVGIVVVGVCVDVTVGGIDGSAVGTTVGIDVGSDDGRLVGTIVGSEEGDKDGTNDGKYVGADGCTEGLELGADGATVGDMVGTDGAAVLGIALGT